MFQSGPASAPAAKRYVRCKNEKGKALLVAVVLAILVGCDEYEWVSPQEFKQQYDLRNMQTMHSVEYLGQSDGRAFMKIESMSSVGSDKWKTRVVWTKIEELEPGLRSELLKEGKAFVPVKVER